MSPLKNKLKSFSKTLKENLIKTLKFSYNYLMAYNPLYTLSLKQKS